MFLDYYSFDTEVNNKMKSGKCPHTWKLNNILLLNNPQVNEPSSREIKKYFELNENKNSAYQNWWTQLIQCQREMYNLRA